jgi:type IV secretion system protein VirB6
MAGLSLPTPFTVTDETYHRIFAAYLNKIVGSVQTYVAGPLLACVTLWVIVQGVLVMRGDVSPRTGLTKLVMVAVIVGLVTSSNLYQQYVEDVFENTVPTMVQQLGGDYGAPEQTIPLQLDAAFRLGQAAFLATSVGIPEQDEIDSLAFEGAQSLFYFSLWSIFVIFDLIDIMMSVLITFGPLFLLGYLFDYTRGIAKQWIGQIVSYAILLLLASVVATVVVSTILTYMIATFGAAMALTKLGGATKFLSDMGGTKAGQIMGLYEVDMFIMTGNALVVAVPGIAASIGGGVAAQGLQGVGQSVVRHFGLGRDAEGKVRKVNDNTIRNLGMLP